MAAPSVPSAPPSRFDDATFESYQTPTPSQARALDAARAFVRRQRNSPDGPSWTACLRSALNLNGASGRRAAEGLYLVGPVGTGKTHLLASAYHALTPEVPCTFFHSSTLFRLTEPPEAFANRVADRCRVCCIDEMEIDDPANEARLVWILQTLEERGVSLLATSNVEPEQFLSHQFGPERFQHFLNETFRERYRVVFVGGDDYRRTDGRDRPGGGWIGDAAATRQAMQDVYADGEADRWMPFDALLTATTEVAHTRLMDRFAALDRLFVEGIAIETTDDALRLLRVVDDLYVREDAPAFFFTSETRPETWFDPDARAGVEQAVAEKFHRTVSRIYAMCDVREVG